MIHFAEMNETLFQLLSSSLPMQVTPQLPRYNFRRTYQWNYDNAPLPVSQQQLAVAGPWTFCGLPVPSPLGIPAGPLLNGKWVLYYASLGFDVLTYKTVRSSSRQCYPLPNLQPVNTTTLMTGKEPVMTSETMLGSWAVSFGMPSVSPNIWREDIERTRNQLSSDKILSVSVVGSVQPGWSLDDLADDYALCAQWAIQSGADCIETNFSCPNVCTQDGQLYQQPQAAAVVAKRVKEVTGSIPFLIKIGHVPEKIQARELLKAIAPYASGIVMTNSVAAPIIDQTGKQMFDGEQRGICGKATKAASLEQLNLFAQLLQELPNQLAIPDLIACGGISSVTDVKEFMAAGAQATHLATAAMCDPLIGSKIRQSLAEQQE